MIADNGPFPFWFDDSCAVGATAAALSAAERNIGFRFATQHPSCNGRQSAPSLIQKRRPILDRPLS